jgi:hypothetical protein
MNFIEIIKKEREGTMDEFLLDHYGITSREGTRANIKVKVLKRGVEIASFYSEQMARYWLINYLHILRRCYCFEMNIG